MVITIMMIIARIIVTITVIMLIIFTFIWENNIQFKGKKIENKISKTKLKIMITKKTIHVKHKTNYQ